MCAPDPLIGALARDGLVLRDDAGPAVLVLARALADAAARVRAWVDAAD